MSIRRLVIVAWVAASACAVKSDPVPSLTTASALETKAWTTAPALTTSWSKTADLVTDPTTRQKVDALVALSIITGFESKYWSAKVEATMTGIDGGAGREWKAFQDLSSSISKDDAKALLRHESPAIRVYFAEYVSSTMQTESPDLLYPLFGDDTQVLMRTGCTGEGKSVADIALGEIMLDQTEVNLGRETYFELVVNDTRLKTKTRGLALSYLASIDRVVGRRLALLAATDADADWKREGIRALGLSANASDVSIIGSGTKSSNADDRYEAVKALGNIDSAESRDALFPLLADPDRTVKLNATHAYASQRTADRTLLMALIHDPDKDVADNAESGLGTWSPRELR